MTVGDYIFFLGGYDAEMCEIRKILEARRIPFYDHQLQWGAKLSDYRNEINRLAPKQIPVFVELTIDLPLPENAVEINHHNEKAGHSRKTSIEQVAQLLVITLNRWQQLISMNDKAHITGLKSFGASDEEIERIRRYDRKCQGVTNEEEKVAEKICTHFKSHGKLDVLKIPIKHTSPVTDRLYGRYQNILIITPKTVNFFGDGKIVKKLGRTFKNSWYGGNLPQEGFWGMEIMDKISPDKIINFIKQQE